MEFVPLLVLAALNKKVIDWIRVLLPDPLEAKVLIPISWVVGMLLALTFSASPALAGRIDIWPGQTLANADIFLVLVYGVALASLGGVIHDITKPNAPPHDERLIDRVPPEHAVVPAKAPAVKKTSKRAERGAVALSSAMFVAALAAAFLLGYILRAIGVGA